MDSQDEKSRSAYSDKFDDAHGDERDQEKSDGIALPAHVAGSGTLDRLVDTAREYAKASTTENTNKAYAADWKHGSNANIPVRQCRKRRSCRKTSWR